MYPCTLSVDTMPPPPPPPPTPKGQADRPNGKKITNKHMMKILKDVNISLTNIPTFTEKQYPIEYSVV